MEKKLPIELTGELTRLGFVYEVNMEDHPGCFGKSCEGQHLRAELKVWKPENTKFKWSFAEDSGGSFDYVLSRLGDLKPAF